MSALRKLEQLKRKLQQSLQLIERLLTEESSSESSDYTSEPDVIIPSPPSLNRDPVDLDAVSDSEINNRPGTPSLIGRVYIRHPAS